MHVCNLGSKQLPHKIYICMFRQQDTLDMCVYSKNTSQKYTHVQVAKYLMEKKRKKKQKQTRKRNKQIKKRKEKEMEKEK